MYVEYNPIAVFSVQKLIYYVTFDLNGKFFLVCTIILIQYQHLPKEIFTITYEFFNNQEIGEHLHI